MLVEMCICNKEMSWFRNTITNLYNAVLAPVAASRDALAERLQSVRDTASLLYNRTIGYVQETLKNIVENAAKEEEGKRVKVFRITRSMNRDNTKIIMDKITQHRLPEWLRKKRCINALDTFDDNLCVWRCLAIYTRRDVKRGSEFVTKEALKLARE